MVSELGSEIGHKSHVCHKQGTSKFAFSEVRNVAWAEFDQWASLKCGKLDVRVPLHLICPWLWLKIIGQNYNTIKNRSKKILCVKKRPQCNGDACWFNHPYIENLSSNINQTDNFQFYNSRWKSESFSQNNCSQFVFEREKAYTLFKIYE